MTAIAALVIAAAMIRIMLYKPGVLNTLTSKAWEDIRAKIDGLLGNPEDKSMTTDNAYSNKRESTDAAAAGRSINISDNSDHDGQSGDANSGEYLINEDGKTVLERIAVPEGFQRVRLDEGSFGDFLRNLPLKPHDWKVHYYDGSIKPGMVYEAVIDMDIGNRDLQQCADSIIRLRAEYLYSRGLYDKISFNFTNGFKADYSSWMQGNRIKVMGNDVSWYRHGEASNDYDSFRSYLDTVFAYAGTLSLSKEMKKAEINDMQPGDVFIKGGSPGHCVIVLDMAENAETGEKIFILAQGYMPAQEMHIVKNPRNNAGNPWYTTDFGDELDTPEWNFTRDQLMRFED